MAEKVLRAKGRMPYIPDNIPTVKYPEEVIERLNIEFEIGEAQIASGEIKGETVEEFAARHGVKRFFLPTKFF